MKRIKLKNNLFAIVDDEDFKYLSRFSWCATNKGVVDGSMYVQMVKQYASKSFVVFMHEFIIEMENADCVIYKNKNTLDLRKENLLAADRSLMMQRAIKYRTKFAYSKNKGLTWRNKKAVWEVRITKDKKTYYLGSFKKEKDAARVYNEKAVQLYGEYAYQNKL